MWVRGSGKGSAPITDLYLEFGLDTRFCSPFGWLGISMTPWTPNLYSEVSFTWSVHVKTRTREECVWLLTQHGPCAVMNPREWICCSVLYSAECQGMRNRKWSQPFLCDLLLKHPTSARTLSHISSWPQVGSTPSFGLELMTLSTRVTFFTDWTSQVPLQGLFKGRFGETDVTQAIVKDSTRRIGGRKGGESSLYF